MSRSKYIKITIIIFLLLVLIIKFLSRYKNWEISGSSGFIAFSSNGKMVANASGTGNRGNPSIVEIRNAKNGKIIQSLDFSFATNMTFSYDNRLIAAGNYYGDIKVWRLDDGQLIHTFKEEKFTYSGRMAFLTFSADGKTLVASEVNSDVTSKLSKSLTAWDISTGEKLYTLSTPSTCAAVSSDSKIFAISGVRQPLSIYRLEDGSLLKQIDKGSNNCRRLRFSNDGKLIAFDSIFVEQDGVYIINLTDEKLVRVISHYDPYKYQELPTDIAISPDGNYLACIIHEQKTNSRKTVKLQPYFSFV